MIINHKLYRRKQVDVFYILEKDMVIVIDLIEKVVQEVCIVRGRMNQVHRLVHMVVVVVVVVVVNLYI